MGLLYGLDGGVGWWEPLLLHSVKDGEESRASFCWFLWDLAYDSGSGKTIIRFNKLLNFQVKGEGKEMKTRMMIKTHLMKVPDLLPLMVIRNSKYWIHKKMG